MAAVAAVTIFVVAYVMIASERIPRTAVALGGAAVMLLLHVTDARAAFFSEQTGIDWNVVFLLLGMMVIVSVLRQTGVFEYVAIWAAKRARGAPGAFLELSDIFGELGQNPIYANAFSDALSSLWARGVRPTLAAYLSDQP